MLENILIWAQLGVSVLLAVSILLQNRGAGLSASFGGDFGGYYTKRGMEKFLNIATVIFAIIFIGLAIANVYIGSRSV
ncbi:MAG TPA: preprotein translocase subunit SecG [Candidatus Bathyarchaeia archaeon]|nr:preprotein translocase subunit SecG [Candidatus Bathyarchaeia archaeon]